MTSELTMAEMRELGFEKCGKLYVKHDGRYVLWTPALENGNAPVGGHYYNIALLA